MNLKPNFIALVALLGVGDVQAAQMSLKDRIDAFASAESPRLVEVFKQIHRNPELAFEEKETAALIAKELRDLGYEVKTGIGKTGVVGILRNGDGPVIMYRADMDALPVKEQTGLPYASSKIGKYLNNPQQPIMHACGHDAHVTWLMGVAKLMVQLKAEWSGTLVLVGQPAEELGEGAVSMVKDGLYSFAPKADTLISAHVYPVYPAGSVSIREGRRMAGMDMIDVHLPGIGGHGSTPHTTKDPVVMGAQAVMGYQTIISRMINQAEPAVLTVGAFHAGTSNNIISSEATLRLNLRWFDERVRQQMIDDIKSVTEGVMVMNQMPVDSKPEYIMKGSATPVVNGAQETVTARQALVQQLGADKVLPGIPPIMGSEDFPMLAQDMPETKTLFVEIGGGKADAWTNLVEKGEMPRAMNHNPTFVVEQPAIAAGVRAIGSILMAFLTSPGSA